MFISLIDLSVECIRGARRGRGGKRDKYVLVEREEGGMGVGVAADRRQANLGR